MRELFASYFPPTEEFFDRLWANSLIVVDANVLLDMYRYTEKTRSDFLSLFEHIQDRLWLPHQAALEFALNRPSVIATQEQMFDKAMKLLTSLRETTTKEIKNILSFRCHPVLTREEFQQAIDKPLLELEGKVRRYKDAHPDIFEKDIILEKILGLFDDKVGQPYDVDRLKEIYVDGKERYERKMPPGYEDASGSNKKKGDDVYGDLVLWIQILDHAEESGASGVILLTNDMKHDWWWYCEGRNLGCRPELKAEMQTKANALFHMYTSERFLHFAPERINVSVNEESIAEVRTLEKVNLEKLERQTAKFARSLMSNILSDQRRRNEMLANMQAPALKALHDEQCKQREVLNHVLHSHTGQTIAVAKALEQEYKEYRQRMFQSWSDASPSKHLADILRREIFGDETPDAIGESLEEEQENDDWTAEDENTG